ncbi:MAG TPA: hypothetical protein VMR92_07115 [Gemmatimonadales bacterium]|nr:hypothetical protein [Gemmatimonadales bacterium]
MRRSSRAPALLVLLACCKGGATTDQSPRLLDGIVAFPPRDTVRFSVPATTHRCTEARTVVLEALGPEGNGVLVRLHYRDSLAPVSYPVIMPGDTTAPGAAVAVRYQLREVGHSFAADSGTVEVHRSGDELAGRMQLTGIENGIRTPTRIEFHDVPLPAPADTMSCAFQP